MWRLSAMVIRSSLTLLSLATVAYAQSTTAPVEDAVVVEQIEPLAEIPLDHSACQEEETDSTCDAQDTLFIKGKTPDADAKLIVLEDGAYLRLGKTKPDETTKDTILDLSPLAPSD